MWVPYYQNGGSGMYSRLCLVNNRIDAGRIHSLLRRRGLVPLIRRLPARAPEAGADQYYSIELPEDELAGGTPDPGGSRTSEGLGWIGPRPLLCLQTTDGPDTLAPALGEVAEWLKATVC